jgi:hypothetical protein
MEIVPAKKDQQDPRAFLKLVATVVGALGGFTAIFAVLGYVIVLSFISDIQLYGLADFPLEFYKEASISLLRDTVEFYSSRPYMVPVAILIVFVPLLRMSTRSKSLFLQKLRASKIYLAVICIFVVVVLTLKLGTIRPGLWGMSGIAAKSFRDVLLYGFSFPILAAIFIYLVYNFDSFSPQVLIRTSYGLFLCFFLILFIAIPIGYGSSIYDMKIYRVKSIEYSGAINVTSTSPSGEFKVFYLMGHTSGREILFDASTMPANPIIIDKALIKAIKISADGGNPMTMRSLLERAGSVTPSGKEISIEKITREDVGWLQYIK